MKIIILLFFFYSPFVFSGICAFESVDSAYQNSEFVVLAKAISSPLSIVEYEKNYKGVEDKAFIENMQAYYRKNRVSTFYVEKAYKGSFQHGEEIKILNYIPRKKPLYVLGHSYVLFMDFLNDGNGLYLADDCFYLDFSSGLVHNYTEEKINTFGVIVNELNSLSEIRKD